FNCASLTDCTHYCNLTLYPTTVSTCRRYKQIMCLRCKLVCRSAAELTGHLLDHEITCNFACSFDCGHPKAGSLASISAHMRHCIGRLNAMYSLLPHRSAAAENH